MSSSKVDIVKVNGYSAIAANDEAVNIFTLFTLHLSCIHSKKTWNKMEINWHPVTLFPMQYIYLMDGINHVFILSHVKYKYCDCVNEDSCYLKSWC